MLMAPLDTLGVQAVDIVASDSGGAVVQRFVVHSRTGARAAADEL